MEENETSSKKEKLVENLHNKAGLSSLRTYKGDMAEYIKDKHESVLTIVTKEREAERKAGKLETRESSFSLNIGILILSILLVLGGIYSSLYLFGFLNREDVENPVSKTEIIPYGNKVTVTNATRESIASEIQNIKPQNNVTLIKISGLDGLEVSKISDFFSILSVKAPDSLLRNSNGEFAFGVLPQSTGNGVFLIIKINDFGIGFASMLEWEETLAKDLSFLNKEVTPANLVWKDLLVKNKDTRALSDNRGNVSFIYTFLDKNTIFISTKESAVSEMVSIYSSRDIIR